MSPGKAVCCHRDSAGALARSAHRWFAAAIPMSDRQHDFDQTHAIFAAMGSFCRQMG